MGYSLPRGSSKYVERAMIEKAAKPAPKAPVKLPHPVKIPPPPPVPAQSNSRQQP